MMAVGVKRLEGEPILSTDRWEARLDAARLRTRRGEALLAAAGESVPDARWYVLLVGKGHDNAVDNALTNARFEHWMPELKTKPKRRSHRPHQRFCAVAQPAFPGMIFVHARWMATTWEALSTLPGVYGVIGGAIAPSPMNDREISDFRVRAEQDEKFIRKLVGALEKGDGVLIKDGPFASFEGVVKALLKGMRLKVDTSIFGREVTVDLDLAQVQKLG